MFFYLKHGLIDSVSIKYFNLKRKYSLDISKIVHVGAHEGQEVNDYLNNFGDIEINLFEPQENIFKNLKSNYGDYKNIYLYNFALGSKLGFSKMYKAENEGQSSSFLKPKKHLDEHPKYDLSVSQKI